MEGVLERTTKEDQQVAQSSLPKVKAGSTRGQSGTVKIKLSDSKDFVQIPKKAFSMLIQIIGIMAEGKSVTLLPSDSQVSTQQAADMLKVSRPHLIKLLEKGEIPHTKVGTHRRIELKDLMAYEAKLKRIRDEQLSFLINQAQDLNLGY